jgi:hypothetical protein
MGTRMIPILLLIYMGLISVNATFVVRPLQDDDLASALTGGGSKVWQLKYYTNKYDTLAKPRNKVKLSLALTGHTGIWSDSVMGRWQETKFTWDIQIKENSMPVFRATYKSDSIVYYYLSFNQVNRTGDYLRLRKYLGPISSKATTKIDYYYE